MNAFGILDKLFGLCLLWLLLSALVQEFFKRPTPRPKVRRMWPVPQSARAFMYGYDPYNSQDAHYGYMRAIVVLAPKVRVTPVDNLVRAVGLVTVADNTELYASVMRGMRYNKT